MNCFEPLGRKEGFYFECDKTLRTCTWTTAWKFKKRIHCVDVGWWTLIKNCKKKKKCSRFFSHLSIQQCHRDVAIDVAPPRAQSGELHGRGRWEGRRQGGRLWGKLELVAAAEMPHLGCCGRVTASQRQGHLVVVRDLCCQGNLWWENITFY